MASAAAPYSSSLECKKTAENADDKILLVVLEFLPYQELRRVG